MIKEHAFAAWSVAGKVIRLSYKLNTTRVLHHFFFRTALLATSARHVVY